MRITRFIAKQLHGYLDFDIPFHERLSLLTGINGSGKTTVLNAVVALISPSLSVLSSLMYDSLKLELLNDENKKTFIEAVKGEGLISLRVGDNKEVFTFSEYASERGMPASRAADMEAEHFRDLTSTYANHPVLKFIARLPTPMFLGLDRRARTADERRYVQAGRIRAPLARNVFGGSMVASLADAEELVQSAVREASFRVNRIGESLQRELLLGLLSFSREDFEGILIPTDQERKDLKRARDDLDSFPILFGLSPEDVRQRVKPFLDQLQKAVDAIPRALTHNDLAAAKKPPNYISDLLAWSSNRSQLTKIKTISQVVAQYNERRSAAMMPFERYKTLINDFLKDSGKTIDVDSEGFVVVGIDGVDEPKPLSSLSSGETQIFIILTNLAFNEAAQRANVFIIDEPELSLHVRWQELFVDSVLTSNNNTQFIMATHSPSIILERVSACVEVVGKKRQR